MQERAGERMEVGSWQDRGVGNYPAGRMRGKDRRERGGAREGRGEAKIKDARNKRQVRDIEY